MAFDILSPSEQVAQHLEKLIRRGRWDQHLPGTPALAKETGADRKTITAAIQLLEKQGIVVSQGAGRPRKIILPETQRKKGLNVGILLYEENDRHRLFFLKICNDLSSAGHNVSVSTRSLTEMGMDQKKVARYVRENPADVWVPLAASKEILEWFATQPFATMALFGRRRGVPIAGVGPEKTEVFCRLTEKLIELGHERIVLFSREERLFPTLGIQERRFLETLEAHGIHHGRYNLPNWKSNAKGFKDCLDGLFKVTPPTALIIEESQFLLAALLHLSRKGISVPDQVSLLCTDDDPVFQKCDPPVTCISWPTDPVVRHMVRWVNQVSRGKVTRKQVFTPAGIVEGGTIGPAPGVKVE